MSELSISVPLILGGKSISGEVFLERAVTEAISRSGARILCKQSLAPGDVVKFLLPDQEHQCAARVINAGPRKDVHLQFLLEMDAETLPFWSLLYLAAQCVAPSSASALALQAPAKKVQAAENGADEIQE